MQLAWRVFHTSSKKRMCCTLVRGEGLEVQEMDVGEDEGYLRVLLVDVGGEEEAGVDDAVRLFARGVVVAEGEGALVDGADVDVEVADVGFLVVDVAGEGEVEGAVLADEAQAVVFPLDGGVEGVGVAADGEDFLEDGDVVEVGGVDDDAEDGVVGGGGDGDGERAEG